MTRSLIIRGRNGVIEDILTDSPEIKALMDAGQLEVVLVDYCPDKYDTTFMLPRPGMDNVPAEACIDTLNGDDLIRYAPELVDAIRSAEPHKEFRP